MRRILIAGSTQWKDRLAVWNALNSEMTQFPTGIVVVHGGAAGADDIADRWAHGAHGAGHRVDVEVLPSRSVDSPVDVVHAFPLEGDEDTRHAMSVFISAGVRVVNHGFGPYTEQAREIADAYLTTARKTRKAWL